MFKIRCVLTVVFVGVLSGCSTAPAHNVGTKNENCRLVQEIDGAFSSKYTESKFKFVESVTW